MKLVCFYGAESTGKTEMAKKMAAQYRTEYVPEVAREFISSNNFTGDDIVTIGHAQTQRVLDKIKSANKILICDTDLITTQIYAHHYLGKIPPVLFELEKKIVYDRYFFFEPDVPWVSDGMRDLKDKREQMSSIFKSELDRRGLAYITVKGNWDERNQIVQTGINQLLGIG